jgi:hypothetical protein
MFSFFIVAIVFTTAYWIRGRFLTPPPPQESSRSDGAKQPTDRSTSVPTRQTVTVAAVTGVVERREGSEGQWAEVRPDDELGQSDAIRTREGGRVNLTIGETIKVDVAESSQFTVSEITQTLSNIRLEGGRISAGVAGGGVRVLKVEVKGSGAVAETAAGEFSVLRTEDARVTVAAIKGSVKLSARGKSIEVGSGKQSVVAVDEAPAAPTNIPPSLFLKINTTLPRRMNRRQTDVEGFTLPGAVVTIKGVNIPANADGSFRAAVPLIEGRNEIVVAVGDVLGRSDRRTLPTVFVDTQAPKVKSEVTW